MSVFLPLHLYYYQEFETASPRYSRLEPGSTIDDHFIDRLKTVPPNERAYWKCKWKYQCTICGISGLYRSVFTRGYLFYKIKQQNDREPYHSREMILSSEEPYLDPENESEFFVWGASIYQIPGSCLMCAVIDPFPLYRSTLEDLVLVLPPYEEDPWTDKYSFLPFRKHQNVPFYEIRWTRQYFFLFVFPDNPEQKWYWKSTGSQLCYPTDDPSGYMTSLDCFQHTVSQAPPFQHHYFQDPMTQIREIGKESQEEEEYDILSLPSPSSPPPSMIDRQWFYVSLLFGLLLLCTIILFFR